MGRDMNLQVPGTPGYLKRRSELEWYFDRTAVEAWARLTSDAPVSRIRATVRAGRDAMRSTLLGWLPSELRGRRVLDAGCGTGAFAVQAATQGAEVIAVDIAPTLIALARERAPRNLDGGRIDFRAGDMLDERLGRFDHVVAMDSLIHYQAHDITRTLAALAGRTNCSILFTFAPSSPLLATMHAVGRVFPRGNRAPAIEPVAEATLRRLIAAEAGLSGWRLARSERIQTGFYTSQALELDRR